MGRLRSRKLATERTRRLLSLIGIESDLYLSEIFALVVTDDYEATGCRAVPATRTRPPCRLMNLRCKGDAQWHVEVHWSSHDNY